MPSIRQCTGKVTALGPRDWHSVIMDMPAGDLNYCTKSHTFSYTLVTIQENVLCFTEVLADVPVM